MIRLFDDSLYDPRPRQDESFRRIAWFFWGLLIVIVGVLAASGEDRNVSASYRRAAVRWLQGDPLYLTNGDEFLYLPIAATIYTPLLPLPIGTAEVIWRAFAIAVFAWGLRRIADLIRTPESRDPFPLMTIFTLPIAWSSARDGQSTLAMAGLMMVATQEYAARRWIATAVALSAAVAIKPLAIVMVLLTAGVRRPMRVPLAASMAIVLTVPFLMQHPWYVVDQYFRIIRMLPGTSEIGLAPRWAQVFSVLHFLNYPVPAHIQTVIRLAAAFATLGLMHRITRTKRTGSAAVMLYGFSATYMMLFNPRTENNTYVMLAPVLAALIAEVYLIERRPRMLILPILMSICLLGNYELAKLLAPNTTPIWLSPIVGVGVGIFLIIRSFPARTTPAVVSGSVPLALKPGKDEASDDRVDGEGREDGAAGDDHEDGDDGVDRRSAPVRRMAA